MKFKTIFKQLVLVPLCLAILLSSSMVYGTENPLMDQTTRLAALAKVWGLLKYYHPEVAKGEIDWDAALISAIPAVKAAVDYDSFNQEIDNLIIQAGDVSNDYNSLVPAHPNEKLFKWLKDETVFNDVVMKKLQTLQKKHVPAENYYVQYVFPNGNVSFENEKRYDYPYYPDENYRLLSLFRYWNGVRYFFAYHEDMDRDWDLTLEEFIPRMIHAGDLFEYHLGIKEMIFHLNDSHGFCYSGPINYYFGYYMAPVELRYIEGKTIVTRVYPGLMNPAGALQVGDIILKCRGQDVDDYRDSIRKYIPASNEPAMNRNINEMVARSQSPTLNFTVLRNGQIQQVTLVGSYYWEVSAEKEKEDNKLDKWKILPGNIGYVHMGIITQSDVNQCMAELMNTKAILFDLRNYPKLTMYYFAFYLIPTPTPFVEFTYPNLDFPGEFNLMTDFTATWTDNPDYYKGRVVILMDERTQSQAEFTIMVLQTAPDVTLIGSQTAGADGNVSYMWLPGYIAAYFTGLGIYYPDGSPTQRIGIVPDIYNRPTVTGIQAGRDEMLERAVHFIENNQ
jgi:C-terminal processing protease CtpA/Prc